MKAAQYNKYGGVEVIEINNNAPKPTAALGQVLVEVHAASLNPIDWKVRNGYFKSMPITFPVTIGGNFSGVVTKLGENASGFKVGDEVFGQSLILNGGSGSLAEFTVSNVANTALKPKTVNHIEASSLPLVGASAIQALEEHIGLGKAGNKKILIHGGAGGIGTIAIQLAKHIGAYVATTVSADDKEYVKNLGADQAIDYKNEKFEDVLKDFDAVFDTVGGKVTDRSFKALKRGGILVSMLGEPSPELAKQYGVTVIGEMTKTDTNHLVRLTELVDKGVIKPQVDKIFSLDQTRKAFEHLEKGHPRGKVVIKILDKDTKIYQT